MIIGKTRVSCKKILMKTIFGSAYKSFVFQHFCCEDFQKELEKLLFSRGGMNFVRDICKSQVAGISPSTGKAQGKGQGKSRKKYSNGRENSSAEPEELDTLTRLLEDAAESESSSSSSGSSEGEENEGEGSSSGGKAQASTMKGKFRERLKSSTRSVLD